MTHQIETKNGNKIHVEDYGSGQPIVFLHGWPANNRMFEAQSLSVVEKGYRYIGIDYKGYGGSDITADGYSYGDIADDIQQVVETLDLKNIVVVGFSVGGPIALKYAVKYNSDNLNKMILISPAAPSFVQQDGYDYGMKKAEVDELIEGLKQDRPKALGEFGENFFSSNVENSKDYKTYFHGLVSTSSLIATVKLAESLRDADLREEIKDLDLPIFGIHGKEDAVCPIEFSDVLEDTLPNYTLHKVDDAGHAIFHEKQDEVNQLINDILKK
ncbi:alpha/beta fold hydrolase [Salinicoccus hispanicus]|uniref:Alpha/beta fold hydrolase n=1 Tax=Salinicoccus hispanicus TaxID=157225 RepID=A0A6N8U6A3_9STAP|nr:alpha/beta hydrolase [Salinicoccus hispanicus]MXQ52055.1 alpha/beta fold hydrolase [Salinicoccus hispanicus]